MEIITSILTSATVTGILVFIFTETYKVKLAQVIRKLDRVEMHQEKDFDQSFIAIKDIWISFAQLDDYLRHDFSKEISNGVIDSGRIRPYFLRVRESMALLPDCLYEPTENSLDSIGKEWNRFTGSLRKMREEINNGAKEADLLPQANQEKNEFNAHTKNLLKELRKTYRWYINKQQTS